jgi:hypothetical protein
MQPIAVAIVRSRNENGARETTQKINDGTSAMTQSKPLQEPNDVLYRIKRGLSGYVSYLAACEMNEAFSEYVLYEPILRVLTARGYAVQCEVPCPGIQQPTTGDRKKLDFVARGNGLIFAMEVKWARNSKPSLKQDLLKLAACSLGKVPP